MLRMPLKLLAALGVAGCAPTFSSVEEARGYLLQNPTGDLAQEAFCIVAAAGQTADIPAFARSDLPPPSIENCTADGRVIRAASTGSSSAEAAVY